MLRVRTVLNGIQGAPYLSTMYFGNSGSLANAQNANLAVGTFWGAIDNLLGNTMTWSTQAQVEELNLAGNIIAAYGVTPQTGTGSLTGTFEAPVLQGVIQWRTGVYAGGREVRGRTFVPCHLTGNNNGGVPSTAYKNGLNAAAATIIADVNADLVIWSKTKALSSSVLSGNTWGQWAVLRSRRD